jgi:hypothetical protein
MKKTFTVLIILSIGFNLSLTSCQKKKKEKNNYMEIQFPEKKDQYELENLSILVTHFKSTDTYSFTMTANKPISDKGGIYKNYDLLLFAAITNFSVGGPMNFSSEVSQPNYRIELSGKDGGNNYGSYFAESQISQKNGKAQINLEVVDFDKKIIRGTIEASNLIGLGWTYATQQSYDEMYFNFVDFNIIEEE